MSEQMLPPQSASLEQSWEQAYLAQAGDAAVGRLFRGVVHNLNGVLQVSSLHGDMEKLMLGRARELLDGLQAGEPVTARPLLAELSELLATHGEALEQLQEKTRQGTEILRRVLALPPLVAGPAPPWSIKDVLACEIEFLSADSFFKHKVEKKVVSDPAAPPLSGDLVAIHQMVHLLLVNALEALRDQTSPLLAVQTREEGGQLLVVLADNGPGVTAGPDEIFAPFFTTREGHRGLGLYLARKLARQAGGELKLLAAAPGATFQLELPL